MGLNLYIADGLEPYADSLRAIVRDHVSQAFSPKASEFKSVYVTLVGEGSGGSFPMELKGDNWVWENVTVTDEHVLIEGDKYPFVSKDPLYADVLHKGKRFVITL